jgi:hypothetical protein
MRRVPLYLPQILDPLLDVPLVGVPGCFTREMFSGVKGLHCAGVKALSVSFDVRTCVFGGIVSIIVEIKAKVSIHVVVLVDACPVLVVVGVELEEFRVDMFNSSIQDYRGCAGGGGDFPFG